MIVKWISNAEYFHKLSRLRAIDVSAAHYIDVMREVFQEFREKYNTTGSPGSVFLVTPEADFLIIKLQCPEVIRSVYDS